MILRNKQADDFIKKPSDDIQGILIHGQDSGLINYRTKALVNHYIPNQNDPFLLSTINSTQLNDNPGLLTDELDTYALTNDKRVILLDLTSDLSKEQVDSIIDSKSQSILIINAGELKTTSPSRKAFENDKTIVERGKIDPNVYMEPYISLYKEYEEGLDNPEHNFLDKENLNLMLKYLNNNTMQSLVTLIDPKPIILKKSLFHVEQTGGSSYVRKL